MKQLILSRRIWVSVTAGIYTILLFILSGSLGLFTAAGDKFVNTETKEVMSTSSVVRDFLTIGNFEILIFFIAIAIICGVYFKDKELQLKARLDSKNDRITYFKESLLLLLGPIFVAIGANFLIRSLLFMINQDILSVKLEISYFTAISTYLYIAALSLLGITMNFFFQLSIKPIFTAAIAPMFMFEGIVLIFGVSNLFATTEIPILYSASNFMSELVAKYTNLFYNKLRVETLGIEVYFITMLACIAISAIFLAISCRFLVRYNNERLNLKYRFETLRRVILVEAITLIVMYLSIAILGGMAFLDTDKMTLDNAFKYTAVSTLVIVPILSIILDIIYRKINNLSKSKDTKVVSKKTTEDAESEEISTGIIEDIEVQDLEDENLSNKGIIKETKLATLSSRKKNNEGEIDLDTDDIKIYESRNIEEKENRETELSYINTEENIELGAEIELNNIVEKENIKAENIEIEDFFSLEDLDAKNK